MPTGEPADLHRSATELLRSNGHRYTPARRHIVEALRIAGSPLTIPQLLACDGRLTLSSTYRNLTVLEQSGITTRLVTPDDHARFELDEMLTRQHHHHLICTGCGDVQDFELPESIERSLTRALDRAGRAATFRVDRHRLDLLGICAGCG